MRDWFDNPLVFLVLAMVLIFAMGHIMHAAGNAMVASNKAPKVGQLMADFTSFNSKGNGSSLAA